MPDPIVPPQNVVPPANQPNADWTTGIQPEILGHWQNKGLQGKSAAEVAVAVTQQYREAEKFIGAPADQIARIPKADAPPEEIKAFWGKLGAPQDPTGYKFDDVKDPKGNPINPALADAVRAAAAGAHLPAQAASQVASALVKFQADQDAARSAEATAKLSEQKAALAKLWGPNAAANEVVAKIGAAKLGISPEAVAALEGTIGFDGVMEAMRKVGALSGEATFISGGLGPNAEVMTRDQAVSKKADLMKDEAWTKRYMAGGVAEQREMTGLLKIITGDDTEWSRRQ